MAEKGSDGDLGAALGLHNNPIDVVITFHLSEGTFHNLVTSAIEGGFNQWARIDIGEHQLGWRNYFTAKFTVIEDSDEKAGAIKGQTYELSLDKLKSGLQVLATKYPHHFNDIVKENSDAITGDALVQCALFGDIVYS